MNFKKNGGFTLVELIVVIAILAILGGVAVPAYSGYVEKANKGADVTLIGEIQHALTLYYYSHPDADLSTAWVKVDQEGQSATAGETGDAAMQAVFGVGWKDAVGLKWADWKGDSSSLSYAESSYYGKESQLIGTVDKLTTALGKVVADGTISGNNLIGGDFEKFLKDNNVKTENNGKGVGNAAVLYVAEKTQGKQTEITNAVNVALNAGGTSASQIVRDMYASLIQTKIGDAAAMAVIYAYAEGYAQATGQESKFHDNTKFENVTNVQSALDALGASFDTLDPNDFNTYVQNQGGKDLQAYMDMMGTVHNNADLVSGNLNAEDCFTDGTVENMLKGHATMSSMSISTINGQVAVGLGVDADGTVITAVTPINWNVG